MKGANAVHDINIKASNMNLRMEDDAADQVHAIDYVTVKESKGAARIHLNSNDAKDEMAKMRWKDAAEAVNAILGGFYIFCALVMGSVCAGLWAFG